MRKENKMNNQKGQGIMEYMILTSLVGIFCLVAVKQIGKSLNTRLKQMDKKIIEHVQIK